MGSFNDSFLKACRREKTPYTPVWFMRQAGRYMAEYRELRKKYGLLEIAKTPELAVQVTLQPLKRFSLDAAILFADILLPLEPMGCPFSFQKGEGPVIANPIRSEADIARLQAPDAGEALPFVSQAIEMLRGELNVPLIGFAGGPFTLASYMIEGGHSRHYQICKTLMFEKPRAWHELLEKIARVTFTYLSAQIEAGAQAVQLFDTWVGCLSPEDYREYVFPHSQSILQNLRDQYPNVPRIHFGTGTAMLLPMMAEAGASVIGVDWQTPLAFAKKSAGDLALQGNLEPLALFAPEKILQKKVEQVLNSYGREPGHIFNLGHGILPETPVESVAYVVDTVHGLTGK